MCVFVLVWCSVFFTTDQQIVRNETDGEVGDERKKNSGELHKTDMQSLHEYLSFIANLRQWNKNTKLTRIIGIAIRFFFSISTHSFCSIGYFLILVYIVWLHELTKYWLLCAFTGKFWVFKAYLIWVERQQQHKQRQPQHHHHHHHHYPSTITRNGKEIISANLGINVSFIMISLFSFFGRRGLQHL